MIARGVRREGGTPIVLAFGLVMAIAGVAAFWLSPLGLHDFSVFYQEGVASRQGAGLYTGEHRLNLNSPVLSLFLFRPLSTLSYDAAKAIWLIASGVSVGLSAALIRRELQLSPVATIRVLAGLLATQGAFMALRSGQVTWLLLLPMTAAWALYRRGSNAAAGAVLGIAIAMKPPLALMALLLSWSVCLVAGGVALAISLLSLILSGVGPWQSWLEAGARVTWLGSPANASLWGLATRLRTSGVSGSMADLTTQWQLVIVITGLVLGWLAYRHRRRDERFLLAFAWSLLLSPLGWAYYLPLAWGPVVALWTCTPVRIAYAVTLIPVAFNPPGIDRLPITIFSAALLCAWALPPSARGQLPPDPAA